MEVMMMSSGNSADVAWRLGRIMLKYRPIAPRPVSAAAGAVTGGGGSAPPAVENCRGKKRRRAAPAGGRRTRRGRKAAEKQQQEQQHSAAITTLPLMPETPERKEEEPATPTGSASATSSPASASADGIPAVVVPRPVRPPAWSSVTVETVTDAWWDGGEPFGHELLDACPAFVSDGLGGVVWANEAYRRMVGGAGEEEARVALVTEGVAVPAGVRCFACRVRVRFACRSRGKVSVVVPCDVWRLADGRKMVWRLDVKAALTLSSLS
ncbi:putative allergen Asp f 7-like protein [Iris pallida]|uniref:Allergen Asp f 7-like protein n=1 Tax=Iris pallida TaxID=29817 RepID=A0AAX6G4C6_IRIPA|nr:putative allergen Asp f 7-like protein [Iris pallida]KAJ6823584.1 putative allergen Asp f 7-like protein [Iris pallida]